MGFSSAVNLRGGVIDPLICENVMLCPEDVLGGWVICRQGYVARDGGLE